MPYISSEGNRREELRNGEPALTAGELNYQIFYFIKHFDDGEPLFFNNETNISIIRDRIKIFIKQFLGKKPNYQRYNDLTGCLIRCYKEISRRLNINLEDLFTEVINSYDDEIAKYEDTKIISNGDVE